MQFLHGIQLKFADGSETPYYHGMKIGQKTQVEIHDIDTQRIAAIAMQQTKDKFTGIRFLDETGDFIFNYTW